MKFTFSAGSLVIVMTISLIYSTLVYHIVVVMQVKHPNNDPSKLLLSSFVREPRDTAIIILVRFLRSCVGKLFCTGCSARDKNQPTDSFETCLNKSCSMCNPMLFQ